MYKIAIANEKGGVAKTTSAISLAAGLSEQGQRVVLLDLDPQANLTLSLGLDPATTELNALRTFEDFQFLDPLIMNTEFEKISIVPVATKLFVQSDKPESHNYSKLRNLLDLSSNLSDFLIMDCPPQLGWMTRNAITAADLLIIPTQAEYFSIYALKTMIQMIKNIRSDGNSSLVYKLLITMFDKRNKIHTKMMEELRSTFGSGVFESYIEIDTKLRESQVIGTPILFHVPSSRASVQYRALTQEIMNYAEKKSN